MSLNKGEEHNVELYALETGYNKGYNLKDLNLELKASSIYS